MAPSVRRRRGADVYVAHFLAPDTKLEVERAFAEGAEKDDWRGMGGRLRVLTRDLEQQRAHLLHLAARKPRRLEYDEDADGLRASILLGQGRNLAHDVALGDHPDGSSVSLSDHDQPMDAVLGHEPCCFVQ